MASPQLTGEASNTNHGKATPRMMITNIILENFKSYAGIQEVGPFHKSFSAVVGPNGSGKSNVIDAMLFVFGRRAKDLRQNKVAELIHHSEKHTDLQQAKVSVYFQDIVDTEGDGLEVVSKAPLVISRTAYKNNSSKYFIGERASNYSEVTELLKGKGIDLDNNRFLILQGEVEQIAMMKPKAQTAHEEGLLEYLEDIIGSNKYVEKIEQAAQMVETANEKRTEKLNRVKVVEKEKEGLEGAKIEAEDCLQKERDIISNKSILVQMQRADAEARVKDLSAQKQEHEDKLKAEKEKARDSLDALEKHESQLKKENKELDVLRKNMEKAKNDFTKYERQDIKLREDIKHMKSREKKLEVTIKSEEKKVAELERNIEISNQDIVKYEKELVNLEKTLKKEEAELEAVYESLKDDTAELNAKLAESQKELLPWSKKLNEARAKVDVGEAELKLLQDKIKEGKDQLEQAKKSLAEGEALLTNRKQEIGKAEKELAQARTSLKQKTEEAKAVIAKELELHKELVALKTKAEETRSSLKETTSKSAVLDSLMKMKAKDKIKGIHGRLGDLGAIDAKYDVAISTACGALDHIVVETAEAGQECVQYLRENNLGFATFILMDKMEQQYRDRMGPIKIPDKAKRLFDLVQIPDARYRTSFYHALRDTLVCTDLDAATSIAYGPTRYRVVTYDGQLIDASGTMSGGGTRVARGLMGSKVVEDHSKVQQEIASLEKKVQALSEKLADVKANRAELENEVHALTARIGELEVAIPKMEMDIKSVTQRQKEIRAGLPVLEQQQTVSASVTKRIKEVTDMIAEDQKELKKITTHTDKLEAKIQELQNQIMDVGGVPLQVAKGKVDSTTQRIDHTKSALTKAKVQLKTGEKNVKKAQSSVEEATQELKQVQKEHEEARAELKKLEDEATVVMEEYKQQETILENKIAELNSVNKEYEKLKKIVSQARSVELDIQHQLEDCTRALAEWQEKTQLASKKYDDLNRKLQGLRVDEGEELEPLPIITEDELEKHSKDEVVRRIAELEEAVGKMKPNMNAIREFRKKDLEYQAKAKELEEVTQERDAYRAEYEGLRKRRLDEFMSGFSTITMKLKEMYQMITLGGDAELELVDSLDPFSEGILFSVRPPKKSWKNISNLSGGEKTLSSLALVFALHHYKPTPLYVMDEIDAALDFKNVSIVANYIKERTRNAQFIIISLRNYMFELADRLVGIYKTEDCTKSVTINPSKFATALRKPTTA